MPRKDKARDKERPEKALPSMTSVYRWWLAACLIIAFIGVNLQLLTHIQEARWFGLILIAVGMVGAIYLTALIEALPKTKKAPRERRDDLAGRFLNKITLGGRLKQWLPIFGILAIVIDLTWNIVIAESTEFLSQDWTMWALGLVLVIYPYVPAMYGKERDFALLFVALFSVTMVLPMGLYRVITGTTDLPDWFVNILLAAPTSFMVNMTGAHSYASGKTITFDRVGGGSESLVISTGCAGLDSLFLFISGFVAFMLIENARFTRPITASLIIGILTAYFANLLRMVIIVLVGVNYGSDAMMTTHENAGSIIFLGWIALFWYLMYTFVLAPAKKKEKREKEKKGAIMSEGTDELRCANCGKRIDPKKIPKKCPKCGQRFEEGLFCDSCGREIDPDDVPESCPDCGNDFGQEEE